MTGMSASQLLNLRDEVNQGKCDLAFVRHEPVRTVQVLALRILSGPPTMVGRVNSANSGDRRSGAEDDNERVLVKVGEVKAGTNTIKASCVLPGTKLREQEPTTEALQRLLSKDLFALSSLLRVSSGRSQVQEVEMKTSSTYGIRSRYLRTTVTTWLFESGKVKTILAPLGFSEFMKDYKPETNQGCARSLLAKMYVTSGARAAAAARAEAVQVLADVKHIVVLPPSTEDESICLYLWLRARELNLLAGEQGTAILKLWAKQVVVSEESWRDLPVHKEESEASLEERLSQQSVRNGQPPNNLKPPEHAGADKLQDELAHQESTRVDKPDDEVSQPNLTELAASSWHVSNEVIET